MSNKPPKNPADYFAKMTGGDDTEEENKNEQQNTQTSASNDGENDNTETQVSNTGIKQTKTVDDVKAELLGAYSQKISKPKMEDTHVKRTYYIDKELDKRLSKLAKTRKRGFKHVVINEGLKAILESLEND